MFKVELIEFKGDIQEYLAECSSVVRDKQPKSAEKLFNRLLKESYGDTASRVLEYIPCKLSLSCSGCAKQLKENKQLFGFKDDKHYYTNAREMLNWGASLAHVLTKVDFTNYKTFKCETPYFIYGQVSTHNQLTTVSHSQRYAECDRGYWKPPEMDDMKQDNWNRTVEGLAPKDLVNFMKSKGIVRKEVFDRGADMLQNRVFTIGGYTNNPNAWQHFLEQRLDKHTQLETREFTKLLHHHLK